MNVMHANKTSAKSASNVEMSDAASTPDYKAEIAVLRLRLDEAEGTLRALHGGEVDAIVVGGHVYTLGAADAASNRLRGDALAQMEDSVVATDNELRVIYLNPAAERRYLKTGSEILGLSLESLYTQKWVSPVDQVACNDALEAGGFWRGEIIHTRFDGEVMQREGTLSCMFDEEGVRTGFLAVMRDISARVKAEAALKESRARLEFALQSAEIGDWSVELDTGKFSGSALYFNTLGISGAPPDWSSEHLLRMVHSDERHLVERALQAALKEHRELHVEFRLVRHDSSIRWLELHGSVFLTGGLGDRMVGILSDITARKLAERALMDADRRKDEFLATLAHELRNPLAPIRNAAHILSNAAVTPSALQKSSAIVSRQVAHMARLLDDLLDVARITRSQLVLKKEYVSVQAVITAAIETARPIIDAKKHRLEVLVPDETIWIEADPVRMAQVISNLLTNAGKYSDAGASIKVQLKLADAGECQLSVIDTGIGMSPVALESVFQMFAQENAALERSEGGLGIGLALVKGLVELHGGKVEAYSAGVGRGSEFTLRLPLSQQAPHQAAQRAPAHHASSGHRIIIADDNRDAVESLATLLELQGHSVNSAHDGLTAFDLARELRPSVMLLDIGMPGLNGYELARRLRQEAWGKSIVLVAATGWGQDDDRMRAFASGFDAHLTKPFDPAELIELLDQYQP
jgi:PAS domain S-box-containing protein